MLRVQLLPVMGPTRNIDKTLRSTPTFQTFVVYGRLAKDPRPLVLSPTDASPSSDNKHRWRVLSRVTDQARLFTTGANVEDS